MCLHACSPEHVQIVITNGQPLFFAQRDGPWFPTLRLLHQYPEMMARSFAQLVLNCRSPRLECQTLPILAPASCGAIRYSASG